ncbi:spermidine synthase [Novosphingobium album (ex Liu et al. 2023)]|uniref:Fused MFS/spermidine synthase n=1 Tax=Novosphingobium album (ex Liu et al. 2023) TaxID=3031130 RepID=A0ABT5WP32_9SPHN|nr:fused MFS/spermidine synthase [Novosphingobium album (ex Liu et al. 2023)]MDE8651797.1 fused MFS/spermidine synthase [Novosphingobium album (ex Liu et al. 2023)]
MTVPARRALFVATILVGSFLLFLVQPMVARMALPRLGGAPNVWNSAMLVYQALLLAGYAYAHWLSRWPLRRQAGLHLALLLLAAVILPLRLADLPPPVPGWEVLWVPLLFVLTVGPVFFVVSAQAPLMQRWFAASPAAGEPWSLYAASNIGSFAGLIAYPLLAEPLLSLHAQSVVWSLGYAALIVLVALAAGARWRAGGAASASAAAAEPAEPIGWRRIALWLALSAIPSGLMLSTTTHLTTDIFAMPLLWVIPLGLYLLSFVIAFSDRRLAARGVMLAAPAVVLFAGSFAMLSRNSGTMTIAVGSCLLLFVIAIALHARLYELRPGTSRLTLFYFVMSAGGALGGAFTALVAPVAFDWVWEHPLLILAAALVLPLPEVLGWRGLPDLDPGLARIAVGLLLAMTAFLAWLLYDVAAAADPGLPRVFLTVMLTGLGLMLLHWRGAYIAVLAAMMLAQGGVETIQTTLDGLRTRSYFGIYTVHDYPEQKMRLLVHGTTLHGQQSTDPARLRDAMTYYGPTSGVGIAMRAVPRLYGRDARVGVVGLGTGTLACLRLPGQRWTFFEIDPVVLRYSRQGTFTYLRDCAPDARVVLGDARLDLERAPRASFDVLAVDAFTSDAIPLHLLTDEAVGVYLDALTDKGLLLVHISNRYIELEPILAAIAKQRGLDVRVRKDIPPDGINLVASSWVAISHDPMRLVALEQTDPSAPWEDLQPPAPRAWTDDHASILPYIRWNRLLGNL